MATALAVSDIEFPYIDIVIDGRSVRLDVAGSPPFKTGAACHLSGPDTDITFNQAWYDAGYGVFPFLDPDSFQSVQTGIRDAVLGLLTSDGGLNNPDGADAFDLERYHHVVTDDETHFRVVRRTRDLFPKDFGFTMDDLIGRLEDLVGFDLTDIDPQTREQLHIIVRINRPYSNDFNPPHKDIYEVWDQAGTVPRFLNVWVPICGVTPASSLALAPGSHRLSEDRILRTMEGGVVNGNRYRVRTIASWDERADLVRAPVSQGDVLIFSSHLIHGLAVNHEPDKTRVALEFRLFRKDRT
ncbi:MAG: phytanoyl-CoA dioxygenase family protein [Alphaproteobacteria bacterium]